MLDYEGYDYESEVEANRLRGKLREQENKLTDWETRLVKVEGYHRQMVAARKSVVKNLPNNNCFVGMLVSEPSCSFNSICRREADFQIGMQTKDDESKTQIEQCKDKEFGS